MLIIRERKVSHFGHDDSTLAAQICLVKGIDYMKGNDTDRFPISYIWYILVYDQLQIDVIALFTYTGTKETQSTPVDLRR